MSRVIATEGLVKRFGDVFALDELSLEVGAGDCIGLLGPNGAGKSTLIKILCGLMRPSRGRAYVNGVEPYRDRKNALASVGCIVEEPTYYANLNPVTILKYQGELRGMDGQDLRNRMGEVLDIVGLTRWRDKKIDDFSRGMRQRLSIAQAILHEPDILILDEPGLGLDPQGVYEMRQLITRLSSEGRTILLASHVLHEVQETCEEVMLINDGQLLTHDKVENLEEIIGTPTLEVDLLSKPKSAQVERIAELDSVKSANIVEETLKIEFEGDEITRAELLEFLVKELGLKVSSYKISEIDLEDIYLHLVGDDS